MLDLLWVAPEHLSKCLSGERCSVKGDIYGFGIILYEIATRSLPYFNVESSSEGNHFFVYLLLTCLLLTILA